MSALDMMNDHMVRIEHVIWIPGALAAGVDVLPDCFSEEFVEYLPEKRDAALYQQLPELQRFADGDRYPEPWRVAEVLSRRDGFLIQAMTPVATYTNGGKACSFSWGYARLEWLYCADVAQIAEVACEWADAIQGEFKAKATASEPSDAR